MDISALAAAKVVFLFGLAFDCRAKNGKERRNVRVRREDGGHPFAIGDEGQRNGLHEMNICSDPIEKRLAVGCRDNAEDGLPFAECQFAQDVLRDLRAHRQDNHVARVDDGLIVSGNRDFGKVGSQPLCDFGVARRNRHLRDGGRLGQ